MAKIAISNLAWREPEDEQVFDIMRNLSISSLEISPFRDAATLSEARRQFGHETSGLLNQYGIHVVAFQALMFRYPEVSIFKNADTRDRIFKHLVSILEFSNEVGSTVVVFGSPKNKIKGRLSHHEAVSIAKNFFEKLSERAKALNVIFCIEPTPSIYGADFICSTQEAIDFVRVVGHKSLKVNLDIGSSILNNEKIEQIITDNIEYVGHVHVSEPYLKTIKLNYSFHRGIAQALKSSNYKGIISIEMLSNGKLDIKNISEILSFVKNTYQ